jgi:hypothetical protein
MGLMNTELEGTALNSMERSPFSGPANNRSGCQGNPRFLWYPTSHYPVHKNVVSVMSQMNPVHNGYKYFA